MDLSIGQLTISQLALVGEQEGVLIMEVRVVTRDTIRNTQSS